MAVTLADKCKAPMTEGTGIEKIINGIRESDEESDHDSDEESDRGSDEENASDDSGVDERTSKEKAESRRIEKELKCYESNPVIRYGGALTLENFNCDEIRSWNGWCFSLEVCSHFGTHETIN